MEQRFNETLSRVLTNAQDKLYLATGDGGRPKELRLLLNREPPRKTEESKP